MLTIRPSHSYFIIQSLIYSLFFSFIPSVSWNIFPKSRLLFFVYIVILTIYFLAVFIYRTLKFKNTIYKIKKSSIQIEAGVLFRYKLYIPYYSIKYMSTRCNILQKFFGVRTLVIYTVSGRHSIKNINQPLSTLIKHKILSAQEEK